MSAPRPAVEGSDGRSSRRSIPASEAAGFWTLLAGVLADNAASLALHERVGFRQIGVQRRLGQDATGRWRDVVVLERRSRPSGSDRRRPLRHRVKDHDVDRRLAAAHVQRSAFRVGRLHARCLGRVHADQQFSGRGRGRETGGGVDRVAEGREVVDLPRRAGWPT